MMKIVWLIFFHLMFPTLSGARPTQEALQVSTTLPSAVSVTNLTDVSTTVLKAETWLKTNVLAHYPSLPITTILVGPPILCSQHHPNNNLSLLLPALKNIHHSLTRWGLQKHIKLTSSLSSCCLEQQRFERLVKPILEFLESTNPIYSINPSPKPSHFSHQTLRRLSSIDPFGFSAPANVAKNPKPPQPQMAFPPVTMSFSDAPEISPDYYHHHHLASPPYLPPCEHYAPAPTVVNVHRLWCVAKPSVPEETLQEAVDYACGAGGADCEEIMPSGNCYYPESAVAHASYAFNSYWQKNKRNGGTCSFGGTAMLINTDPSYELCSYIIT